MGVGEDTLEFVPGLTGNILPPKPCGAEPSRVFELSRGVEPSREHEPSRGAEPNSGASVISSEGLDSRGISGVDDTLRKALGAASDVRVNPIPREPLATADDRDTGSL